MINDLPVLTHLEWVQWELGQLYKKPPPRVGALGHGPAQGDADCSLLLRYLAYEVDTGKRPANSVGMAWLHEVPYYPLHPHLARLLQESISEARQIRYETGTSDLNPKDDSLIPGGDRSLAFKLAHDVKRSGAKRPLFIVVAQDKRKKEATEIIRSELKSEVEQGKITLLGTRGTIDEIAKNLWQDRLDKGWQPYKFRLHQPILEDLSGIWGRCKARSLNLITVGLKSGAGDLDIAYYVRALGFMHKNKNRPWIGMIWLHSVPYESERAHYNLFLQESVTTANIPYRTSVDGAMELLNDLRKRPRAYKRAILAITADDSMKPALRFVVREAKDGLHKDSVAIIATAGTAAILRELAARHFP